MKWIYTTPGNEYSEIPLNVDLLVQYKHNKEYEVLMFDMDSDYGMVAPTFESYVSPRDIRKYIIITD